MIEVTAKEFLAAKASGFKAIFENNLTKERQKQLYEKIEEYARQVNKTDFISDVSKSATIKSSGDFRDDDNRESQAEYYGRK